MKSNVVMMCVPDRLVDLLGHLDAGESVAITYLGKPEHWYSVYFPYVSDAMADSLQRYAENTGGVVLKSVCVVSTR